MRLSPDDWFDTAIYLPFPASVVFQALMESGSDNPVFMEPWPPNNSLLEVLASITWKMENVDRSPITSLTWIVPMAG